MLYDLAMPNLPSNKAAELAERIRRNHALEHATLHMLTERHPDLRGAGRAQHNGFYLYANVTMEQIAWAADEAIKRMCAGQSKLAIHPGCGTNLVTSGLLTGGLALLMARLTGKRARWHEQLSGAVLGGLVGSFLAVPLGPWMQANVTTSANMQGVRVRSIRRSSVGRWQGYFVETEIVM
jgi:hypothetical protein